MHIRRDGICNCQTSNMGVSKFPLALCILDNLKIPQGYYFSKQLANLEKFAKLAKQNDWVGPPCIPGNQKSD